MYVCKWSAIPFLGFSKTHPIFLCAVVAYSGVLHTMDRGSLEDWNSLSAVGLLRDSSVSLQIFKQRLFAAWTPSNAFASLAPLYKARTHQKQCWSNIVEWYKVECCFDKIKHCFDIAAILATMSKQSSTLSKQHSFVERNVRFVAFDNVASTFLLVWTEL